MAKTIYTGYFAVHGMKEQAVSISAKNPGFFKGRTLKMFAPPYHLLNAVKKGIIPFSLYTTLYKEQVLDKLNWDFVDTVLEDGDILLCWEKDSTHCHRSIVARYLSEHGYDVQELSHSKESKQLEQITLF